MWQLRLASEHTVNQLTDDAGWAVAQGVAVQCSWYPSATGRPWCLFALARAPRSLVALVAGHGRWALETKSVRTALPRVWGHHEGRADGLLVWPTGPLVEMPQRPVWNLFADSGPHDRNQGYPGADSPVVVTRMVTERALKRKREKEKRRQIHVGKQGGACHAATNANSPKEASAMPEVWKDTVDRRRAPILSEMSPPQFRSVRHSHVQFRR